MATVIDVCITYMHIHIMDHPLTSNVWCFSEIFVFSPTMQHACAKMSEAVADGALFHC